MKVTIDPDSGFCFGVVYAIEIAERELSKCDILYCIGDIVHNNMEVNRLKEMGLIIIEHDELSRLHDCKVLIRAHGEPPETYHIALKNNLELIDASCPIVLNLQNEIRYGFEEMQDKGGQIVIYGKEGHAEVNGLRGTNTWESHCDRKGRMILIRLISLDQCIFMLRLPKVSADFNP
jgi:4-hydroxy-3-methylbut-2-enyl diphosphate reductase